MKTTSFESILLEAQKGKREEWMYWAEKVAKDKFAAFFPTPSRTRPYNVLIFVDLMVETFLNFFMKDFFPPPQGIVLNDSATG